jgi:mannose-6-phosphate isomerase
MYLPSGILHAYLEGSGLEIMANSNNVLRGGLTSKHVAIPELLRNVVFDGDTPAILRAEQQPGCREWVFRTPAREFELRRIELDSTASHAAPADHGAEILIVVQSEDDAEVDARSAGRTVHLKTGGVCFAAAAAPYTLESSAPATVYKATMPV